MDCRAMMLVSLGVVVILTLISKTECRNKKVVIHVPFKVKKIKHTHTVYKTVHHHHSHHDPLLHEPSHPVHHLALPSDEHEHFHHMHIHEDQPTGQHTQPVPGIGIPDFLPDVPLNMPDIPDVPEIMPGRHIPLFRRFSSAETDDDK